MFVKPGGEKIENRKMKNGNTVFPGALCNIFYSLLIGHKIDFYSIDMGFRISLGGHQGEKARACPDIQNG